jgi:hypothetical protein
MLQPKQIWCSEICRVIAKEKGVTHYKTKEWKTYKDYPIHKMRKKWMMFIVEYKWQWKRIVWSRVIKWGDIHYDIGNEYIDIVWLPIRTIKMKSPEDLWIFSMSDLWEYFIKKYNVDDSDWQWYCVYTKYVCVTRNMQLEIDTGSNWKEARMLLDSLSKIAVC